MIAAAPAQASLSNPRLPRRLRQARRGRVGLAASSLLLLISGTASVAHAFFTNALGRNLRYVLGAASCSLVACIAAAAYYLLTPPTYVSRWTFILPTATSAVSLQLESIGHAQSIPSSPFGSTSLSPKVIYREIAGSEIVRLEAARALGVTLEKLGLPRIKLIDETSLILFEMSDRTPEGAQAKSMALITAFNAQLEALRKDEVVRRGLVVQESLKLYQENLQTARNRILEQQQATGVLSINQFNEAATTLELLRRKLTEQRSDLEKLLAEKGQLIERLGLSPDTAAAVIRLASNQTFAKMAAEYAEAQALLRTESAKLGPRNPLLVNIQDRWAAADRQISEMAQAVGVAASADLASVLMLMNGTQQADLLRSLVTNETQIAGRRKEIASLTVDTEALQQKVKHMSADVARLEDLKKDHIVAEAVFTSALARLDTHRTDIYASYPMVQTLAPPDLPEKPSSPRLLFAVLGAMLASLLSTLAWGMAWLRHEFARRR